MINEKLNIQFKAKDFTFPSATIAVNGYHEWTGLDISESGWSPIALTRVNTNRSGVVLIGFSLSRSNQTAYMMARNVSDQEITVASAGVTVLYFKL